MKKKIAIICNDFIMVNRVEFSSWFKQTELKFLFNVNKLNKSCKIG